MACPECGGKIHIVREYMDDGTSVAYGVCQVCGWDDSEEQLALLREKDEPAEVAELFDDDYLYDEVIEDES